MMAGTGVVAVYGNGAITESKTSTFSVKVGLAQMLRGGVIMDVVNAEQARIAEEAGACAVMALERVPADIRAQGGVARMSSVWTGMTFGIVFCMLCTCNSGSHPRYVLPIMVGNVCYVVLLRLLGAGA